MWALVIFADEIWYICPLKNVSVSRKKVSVKYKDNKKYAARVIAISQDQRVLEQLKSNLECAIQRIEGDWKLDGPREVDYVRASKEISVHVEGNILFVDKNILPQSNINTPVRSFHLREDIDLHKFVFEVPQFQRLRRDSLKADDSNVATPETVSTDKVPSKSLPRALNQEKTPKKKLAPINNNNTRTETSEHSKTVDSDEILVNETNSFDDPSKNPIETNTIINETPPESSMQDGSFDVSNLPSPGKPVANSTIKELSISLPKLNFKVKEKNQHIFENSSCAGSSIIDSSTLIDEISSTPPEKPEKSNFSRMAPISKPHYCTGNRMSEDKLSEPEDNPECINQEIIASLKSVEEKIQNEGGLDNEDEALSKSETENLGEYLHNSGSNAMSHQTKKEKGGIESNSSVNESSIIPETPDTSVKDKRQLKVQHDDVNGTYTCTTTKSTLEHLQSNILEKSSAMNSEVPKIDEDSLNKNDCELETVTPPSSEMFNVSLERRPRVDPSQTNPEFPESKLIPNDIDPFKNNVYLNDDNPHNLKDEILTQGTMNEINMKQSASGMKRKHLPSIISEESVKIRIFKKQKTDDPNIHDSPNLQKDETQISGYNTRKKDKRGVKCTYSERLESEPEESVPEESISDNGKENDKPQTGARKKVVFDFDESDAGDDSDEYMPDNEEIPDSDGESDLSTDGEELEEDLEIERRFTDSLNITIGDFQQTSAPDDNELAVDSISSSTKKHFCFFCKKLQTKLARHLQLVHSKEEEVKKFMALPPKNKERQDIIATIRKNGDHLYNTDRQYNGGKLIVCRRSTTQREKTAKDFTACGNCKGQYSRSVIRHHWRRCTKRHGKHERIILVKGKKVSGRVHERANADVRKHIFPYLREDEVVRSIRYDELVVLFANKQCEKYGTNPHLYQMIRARLRLLGRFLVAIKQINSRITNFMDVFQARNYDSMIEAVRKVAVLIPETKTFQHPAVGSSLGTLLKQVGEVLRSEFIKRESGDQKKQVEDYLNLLAEDYGTSINRVVTETQTQHHRRKEVKLPSTEDIKKLYSYIVNQRSENLSELTKGFSFLTWKKLGESTLLSLQVFNRRRPGELERLYIEDYRNYRGIDGMADKEIYETLSAEGKALAKRYVRFEIRGKRNRSVPVLIDSDVVECLEMILRCRKEAGVPDGNLYLFGMPSSDKDRHKYLRACDLMREYSVKCRAEIPHLLRGTELRKHIATRCIHLNLEGSQVTDLANFMGHAENIHKQIYRQPVAATDIVKISKILNIVQGVEGADDDTDDENTSQSTPKRFKSNEPSVSGDGSVYGLETPATSYRSQNSRSSIQSEGSTNKRQWSAEQRSAVLSAFGRELENGNIPSGKEMQALIDRENCLRDRTVAQMRTWLHTYKKKLTQ